MSLCPVFHFTSIIETVGFACPSTRTHCWRLKSPSSSFVAVSGEHCRMSLLHCQQPLLHWGFHSLTSCWDLFAIHARLQTSITGRRKMQDTQEKQRSWPGVEELAWNSQAERQKAEASQKSAAEPHLETSPTFQDRRRTLMHRTKHTLAHTAWNKSRSFQAPLHIPGSRQGQECHRHSSGPCNVSGISSLSPGSWPFPWSDQAALPEAV